MSDNDYKVILILEIGKQELLDRVDNDFPDLDPDDDEAVATAMRSVVRDYGTPIYKGREVGA